MPADLTRRSALLASFAALQRPRRPNLLFIVTDGWRGQALPSAGDPNLQALNLARLAGEGIQCDRAYTSYPVCCPSRAAMLTGKYPHAAGVTRNHSLMPLEQPTMSAAMRAAGYRTGYIGKWHLDGGESPGFVPPERRRGFDFWAAYNLQHRHYGCVYFRDQPVPIASPGFEPDHQTDIALEFLRGDNAQPFYLHLAYVAPHAPYTPPAQHARYDPGGLRLRPNVPSDAETAARRDLAGYYGLCSAVDENIGRILKELDARGLAEDTIVVFTSDHGGTFGSHGLDAIDVPFEEACRIPLLIRYPRRIRAGSTLKAPVSNVDFAPTLIGLCGVSPLTGAQGTNLSGLLQRTSTKQPKTIFSEGELTTPAEWRMVVHRDSKLAVDAAGRPTHLFDLRRDPYEQENLVQSASHRGTRDKLAAMISRWLEATK